MRNGTWATTNFGASPENTKETQLSNLRVALKLSRQLMQLPWVPAGAQEFPKQDTQIEWSAVAAVPAGQVEQKLESHKFVMVPELHCLHSCV
jgi:hypothetical protein